MLIVADTIAGRTIAVLVIGLVALHLASLWAYRLGLDSEVGLTNAARTAERLIAIQSTLSALPADQREETAHSLSGGALEVHYSKVPLAVASAVLTSPASALRTEIAKRAQAEPDSGLIVGSPAQGIDNRSDPHLMLVSMRLPDGGWVNTNIAVLDGPHHSMRAILVSTALMALGVLGIALGMARSVTNPIRKCADEAKRVYVANEPEPIPVNGPREVRKLATAFNEMQLRVKKLVDERTLMLAAISHDLKSPLARLRLRSDDVADEDVRGAIEADVDDMLQMINSSLEFLRSHHTGEERQRLDLSAIIETICDDLADLGHKVSLERRDKAIVTGRRLALKRAFANLIGNALKYGDTATVRVSTTSEAIAIQIADSGPGIPENEIENVFRPYYRIEASRNRDTGGTGLGLTVALSIIESHGGSLQLRNRAEGGLVAAVVLPQQ